MTRIQTSTRIAVVRSAPHAQLFPDADVVITHAGHGTLLKGAGRRLLDDPSYRRAARQLGARIRRDAAAATLVDQFESPAGNGAPDHRTVIA